MGKISEELHKAVTHHQAGNLIEAEELYTRIIKLNPECDEALYHLGLLLIQKGEHTQAEMILENAVLLRPKHSQYHIALGRARLSLGKRTDAEKSLQLAFGAKPKHPQQWHNLATLFGQAGNFNYSAKCFLKVLQSAPDNAEVHFNLGWVYEQQGEYEQAAKQYRLAIKFKPSIPMAHNNLGNVLNKMNHYDKAIQCYRQALRLKPDFLKAYIDLGNTLRNMSRYDEAIEHYQIALEKLPNSPEIHNNLGELLREKNKYDLALIHIQHAIQLKPDFPEAFGNQGVILQALGNYDEAINQYQKVLQYRPDSYEAHLNLGHVYTIKKKYHEASGHYMKAQKIQPGVAEVYKCLGHVLFELFQYDEGIKQVEYAIKIQPDYSDAHNLLGYQLRQLGRVNEAVDHFKMALQIDPENHMAHSNLLFSLSYHVMDNPEVILNEHRKWDEQHGISAVKRYSHQRMGSPDKRLRIGYVSPNLCDHVVSLFIEPVLEFHDRGQVEVFCYAEVASPDNVTTHLHNLADRWCSTVGMKDEDLARRIKNDNIDILVDLAGHTGDNRLRVFTYKPAPVQASYLGYFATTGLSSMDYWISDEVLSPYNTIEASVEKIYRIPRCCLTYKPRAVSPEKISHVINDDHVITFGSFNDMSKISPACIELWSQVLNEVPRSQLLLKAKQLSNKGMQTELLGKFKSCGVDMARIRLLDYSRSMEEHLTAYNKIDIALDTVPRTGGTTTMDALWMGVPVITLTGQRFVERLSTTMLNALDLDECIASTAIEYIDKASRLANDRRHLNKLHSSLRDLMLCSPICDGRGLASALESAYREMWKDYLYVN